MNITCLFHTWPYSCIRLRNRCNSCLRIQITHGTNGDPPTGAFQICCDENKDFKIPEFKIIKGNYKEITFFADGNDIPTIHEKMLSASIAATPCHLMIDIVVRT